MQKKIKVVQLQYRVSSSGDFVRRLHNTFLAADIDSSIISLYSDLPDTSDMESLGRKEKFVSLADNRIQAHLTRKQDRSAGLFSYPVLGSDLSKMEKIKEADIIYLHWVWHGFLNLKSIAQLAKLGKPMVFILHDMWSITGGCHYSFSCEKYQEGCHSCYMFGSKKKNDLSAALFRKKAKLYGQFDNLYFASPSKWLYQCARESALTGDKPVYHIPNVLDRQLYKPIDQGMARHVLNLPAQDTIIAFGAVSINSPYKGWAYLKSAMEQLHRKAGSESISVLLFGGADNAEIERSIPFKVKAMGHVKDEHTMALIYNAADVFIAPSLADNLPYTIFESLACGTPVVAFNTGGIPDLIDHRQNGYLADYKDPEDLVRGLQFCLENRLEGFVLPEFDTDLTIQKHLTLFDRMLSPQNFTYSESVP